MESSDEYTRSNADEAEQLACDGSALLAKAWLEADPDNRRIGESISVHGPHHSLTRVASHKDHGIEEMWLDAIASDEHGKSYAQREIWKLPKKKSQRHVIFRGLAVRLRLRSRPKRPKARTQSLGSGPLVGLAGFEPTTPCPPGRCATRLRYSPFNHVGDGAGRQSGQIPVGKP